MIKKTYKDIKFFDLKLRKVLRFVPQTKKGHAFNNVTNEGASWNRDTGEVVIFENRKEWEEFLNGQKA